MANQTSAIEIQQTGDEADCYLAGFLYSGVTGGDSKSTAEGLTAKPGKESARDIGMMF
jgi:hypothetical protein